jgi:hypothetical protein
MPGTMLYISVETFGAFALTCLVIELTPGPNMAYLAVMSAGNGRRAGLPQRLASLSASFEIAHPRWRGVDQCGPVARLIQEIYKNPPVHAGASYFGGCKSP